MWIVYLLKKITTRGVWSVCYPWEAVLNRLQLDCSFFSFLFFFYCFFWHTGRSLTCAKTSRHFQCFHFYHKFLFRRSRRNPDLLCTSVNSFTGQTSLCKTLSVPVALRCHSTHSYRFLCCPPPRFIPTLLGCRCLHVTGITLAANSTLSTGIAAKTL